MSASRADLPDFTAPPVIEVVIGVQFEPLAALRAAHVGLVWHAFRSEFPRVEDRPPLAPAVESFGTRSPGQIEVRLEVTDAPPLPRAWFLNQAGTELLQFQPDRLIHNWRKVGDEAYPRYGRLRDSFREELEVLRSLLDREELGPLVPNQCEITYVNDILIRPDRERPGQLDQIVTLWSPRYSDAFLSQPEAVRLAVQYVIPDDAGEPRGRLHVEIIPAFHLENQQPLLRMTLTARGSPGSDGLDGVFRFFDLGHEWAVRGFASITTPEMHESWGRRDGT